MRFLQVIGRFCFAVNTLDTSSTVRPIVSARNPILPIAEEINAYAVAKCQAVYINFLLALIPNDLIARV